jgi:hypothetical protein
MASTEFRNSSPAGVGQAEGCAGALWILQCVAFQSPRRPWAARATLSAGGGR